jgi:hypothetical protein
MTDCRQEKIEFQGVESKRVEAKFDGGQVTTDAGALLIRELCERRGIFARLTECFTDYRSPIFREYEVKELIEQRVYGLICGHEDLNDHETLRKDPMFQVLVGKAPGEDVALAGKSTLNRLELSSAEILKGEKYKKIACDDSQIEEFFLREFVRFAKKKRLKRLILDFDATDLPLHGSQEERFYQGYYGHYCYLPLYIFCEDLPLGARLRPSNIDASKGTEEELERIVPYLRRHLPRATIIVRGDSAFAREGIMATCEKLNIHYVFGLAKNERLIPELEDELKEAEKRFAETKLPARVFKDFRYCTLESWSKSRRVIGKAEYLEKGPNPRFIVTSLGKSEVKAMELYEQWYCKRGDMENRIKEQLHLFADRMSSHLKRANQLRLWFSTIAYLIMTLFKKIALVGTALAKAEVQTIRAKFLKLAARVTSSSRRVYFSLAESFPLQGIFARAVRNLQT